MASTGFTGDFSKLERWAKRVIDTAPRVLEIAARNMADEALSLVADGFRAEKDPYGKPWEPLKDPTRGASKGKLKRLARAQERRRRKLEIASAGGKSVKVVASHKILQDTGRGRASWHRTQVSKDGFRIAAGATYMKVHQDGRKDGTMAARKQVPDPGPLPAQWKNRMVEAAEEAFRDHFSRG